jgi:tRNA A22 N-methylase
MHDERHQRILFGIRHDKPNAEQHIVHIGELRGAVLQERERVHELREWLQHEPELHAERLHGEQRDMHL